MTLHLAAVLVFVVLPLAILWRWIVVLRSEGRGDRANEVTVLLIAAASYCIALASFLMDLHSTARFVSGVLLFAGVGVLAVSFKRLAGANRRT